MMVFSVGHTGDPPEFILFDTLTPQDHPRNLRWFRVPPRYCGWLASVNTDREMPLGTLNRDGPLITDPAQAFLLVELYNEYIPSRVFIVFRIQTLIGYACSINTDTCIQWDELERDAMIMEVPMPGSLTSVQGVHVVVRKMPPGPGDINPLCLHIFDFSRRGCSMFRDEDGNGAEQTAWYEGGRDLILDGSEGMGWRFCSLGNGSFYHLVSCLCDWKTRLISS
ncbi:hypothetical protein BDM02DRAFT_1994278 [Thelephora ganbajun]|uniref:Uncharacterized protein n=1 Tax=Thelephora ganbajun TaxID=370292 RepID=A0ACB6ZI37_THEGA|nr:hypothetical protein BDM02DRAFT_1994278 [Thelephora ganbajun]